jgi:hypothetical protein
MGPETERWNNRFGVRLRFSIQLNNSEKNRSYPTSSALSTFNLLFELSQVILVGRVAKSILCDVNIPTPAAIGIKKGLFLFKKGIARGKKASKTRS